MVIGDVGTGSEGCPWMLRATTRARVRASGPALSGSLAASQTGGRFLCSGLDQPFELGFELGLAVGARLVDGGQHDTDVVSLASVVGVKVIAVQELRVGLPCAIGDEDPTD
jgi:hypothetical protein